MRILVLSIEYNYYWKGLTAKESFMVIEHVPMARPFYVTNIFWPIVAHIKLSFQCSRNFHREHRNRKSHKHYHGHLNRFIFAKISLNTIDIAVLLFFSHAYGIHHISSFVLWSIWESNSNDYTTATIRVKEDLQHVEGLGFTVHTEGVWQIDANELSKIQQIHFGADCKLPVSKPMRFFNRFSHPIEGRHKTHVKEDEKIVWWVRLTKIQF